MPAIRFRRDAGRHWRTGALTDLARQDDDHRFVAEVIDDRTGNTRTLDTDRHDLEILDAGHWLPVDDWAAGTAPLFTTEAHR